MRTVRALRQHSSELDASLGRRAEGVVHQARSSAARRLVDPVERSARRTSPRAPAAQAVNGAVKVGAPRRRRAASTLDVVQDGGLGRREGTRAEHLAKVAEHAAVEGVAPSNVVRASHILVGRLVDGDEVRVVSEQRREQSGGDRAVEGVGGAQRRRRDRAQPSRRVRRRLPAEGGEARPGIAQLSSDGEEVSDARRRHEDREARCAEDEEQEARVVASADGRADPRAEVVPLLDAAVAHAAVRRTRRPQNPAHMAILGLHPQSVDDQCRGVRQSTLRGGDRVRRGPWDRARIAECRQGHEERRKHQQQRAHELRARQACGSEGGKHAHALTVWAAWTRVG